MNMLASEEQREMTATGLGFEPPLSPPVVGGRATYAPSPTDGLTGLPTPPPAIRPPAAQRPAATLSSEEVQPPRVETETAQRETEVPSITPTVEELPTMAPPEETVAQPPAAAATVTDYFAEESPVELAPVQPSEVQSPELSLVAPPEAATTDGGRGVHVVVRLQDGERVQIGEHESQAAAMQAAQEVIEELATTAGKAWPFYAGRFIRPELIVSIDLVENGSAAA
jgi:hypothetical protein